MVLLLSSALLTPELGIIFWTTLIFCILWFILGKKAWKPIVNALETRENKIATALNEAEKTRQEMAALKSDNLRLVAEAKEERARILKEAKEIKDQIIAEARDKAKEEAAAIVANAQVEIENKRLAAIVDVKNTIGKATLNLTKDVLKRELNNSKAHQDFIKKELKRIALN